VKRPNSPNWPNWLSGLDLDRAASLRSSPERLDEAWGRPDTRVLPVWRSKHLVLREDVTSLVLLGPDRLEAYRESRVLLGLGGGIAYFAVDLSSVEEPAESLGLPPVNAVLGLREVAPLVSQSEGALLAYAAGILSWHRRNRFCGVCGCATRPTQGGHVRVCASEDCGEQHFPRTDPAVIMLVTDGERILLGRQSAWPPLVYSTLAGFVEPGESLEEAVKREVHEETGVEIDEVHYHSSQPWPFPSSLMLGFRARAKTREVHFSSDELEDARWFTRAQVLARDGVELPSTISIARRLIEDWLTE
jgi:NAD+ diphosphatase